MRGERGGEGPELEEGLTDECLKLEEEGRGKGRKKGQRKRGRDNYEVASRVTCVAVYKA